MARTVLLVLGWGGIYLTHEEPRWKAPAEGRPVGRGQDLLKLAQSATNWIYYDQSQLWLREAAVGTDICSVYGTIPVK